MKKTLFLLSWCISLQAQAQKGIVFPEMTGITLQDKTIDLPKDTQGKYTILCLTYSQKSKEALQSWIQPIYDTFLSDAEYDVNLYFVLMFSGLKELAAGTAEKKMKQGFDPVLHKYVILYKGDIGDYKKTLNMPDKDTPYLYLLDKTGKIVFLTSGAYSKAKIEKMEEAIQ
jgi:hypothetical protein